MNRPVALITGASRGIGRAIALQLAEDGFFVIINYYQNMSAAEEVLNTIKCKGYDGMVQQFDVCARDNVAEVIKKLSKDPGPMEVLVNNAGIIRDQPLVRMRDEDWDRVIATNLSGMYHCCKATLKTWAGKKSGKRIINISSIVAEDGRAYQTNYCASKGGIISFTKALARELAPKKITVNAVAPGFIATDATSHLHQDPIVNQIPLGRLGQPEDVAHVVSFLASDKASYITGQVFRVNGGLYM